MGSAGGLAREVTQGSSAASPDYLDTLAAALAELGRFDEAVVEQRRALDLVEGRDLPDDFVASLHAHLARLEAREPIREPSR